MQDKLLLLCEFLNDILYVEDEDEMTWTSERYKDRLAFDSEEDAMYKLWDGVRMLGNEILLLKSSGTDAARNRKLAALTTEEKTELTEVERIIDENCIDYYFQPIVNTVDGGIYSYEALMRPRSDIGLTPYHVLKYAELTDRMNDIERATFLNVLNFIDSNKEKFKDRRVFINSIPKTKLDNAAFRRVGELLMKHSDTAVVELTEQAELDDGELDALKERYMNMDIHTALDDYGTGYSNVQNLLRYMPNYVKIDRSLLNDIQNSPNKRHFVREIIEFCHENGIMALAEGVETSEELRTVIMLGADLIQGFYTAKPNAEVLESISEEIREEIKLCQQERQEGKDQQIYTAEVNEKVLLERLVKDDYKCVLVGKGFENGEVTIAGSSSLDTDIHIDVAEGFKGRIILDNAHLASVKNCPCIDLAENTDITLVINGENKLKKGGIRVPEGARFTLEGDGEININLDSPEFFGIGNEITAKHGELIFLQGGTVTINASGKSGVGIGSGYGGSTTISQGKYVLDLNGDAGVGIGTYFDDCKLDILTCDVSVDVWFARGVAIGSIGNAVDIHISQAIAKVYMGGEEIAAIGTLDGDSANVVIDYATTIVNINADRCTCVGALDQNTSFVIDTAAFRATAGGEKALPFGGFGGDTRVSWNNAETTVKLETDIDIEKYILADHIEVADSKTRFIVGGNEIHLKPFE